MTILAVTMNPSIDVQYPLDHLTIDDVNRVTEVRKTAGGKGLNVARVLHCLNHPVVATGVLGGYFGKYLQGRLDKDGIKGDFAQIDGETRSCIAILHDNGDQTEILEKGPTLSAQDAENFLNHYRELLKTVELVTISGSLPGGLPTDFYAQMVHIGHEAGVPVFLDASGAALEAALKADDKPDLIKPNDSELGALIGEEVDRTNLPQLTKQLQHPLFDGVEWVVVSLGSKGAFAKHNRDFYQAAIQKINVVNPVGSGDSTLAGLAYATDKHEAPEEVLKSAMTCGMLNTMEAKTGFVDKSKFDEYYAKVTVNEQA
ncbi:hexose kinase [Lacticaseibacillus songhuajiangensis]|uniref:hexose kinase n=1 Tax=Lacticaseibacillus songhuajiangensis TaxID=1296539 RepID=UPI000F7B4EF6|nr:hexose kinase [Lacticaseibacillus songhuajiangensis]